MILLLYCFNFPYNLKLRIAQIRSLLQDVCLDHYDFMTEPGEQFCRMSSSVYFISRTISFQVTAAVRSC